MTHPTQEIPKEHWRAYFDDLSRRMGTVEATLEVDGRDLGAQTQASRVVVTGISYDDADDVLMVALDVPGGHRGEAERLISNPQRVLVDGTFPSDQMALAVDDGEGHRTLVRMWRPGALPGPSGS
jgi:hypothetical protein